MKSISFRIILPILVFSLSQRTANGQTIWCVDASVSSSGDGTTWATAKKTFQEGIDAATPDNDPPDQVWVKTGTYKPNSATDSFILEAGVRVYGGFAGDEELIPISDTHDPRVFDSNHHPMNQTILSGEIGSPGISDNVRVIVTAPANDSDYILDGFVIEAAREHGLTAIGNLSGGSSGSFRNLIVRDNINDGSNSSDGGGMYIEGDASRPTIDKCLFARNESRNSTGFGGGAIYCFLASADLSDTRFEDNMAQGLVGGGAFHIPDQITSAPHQMSDGRDEFSHVVPHVCHYV